MSEGAFLSPLPLLMLYFYEIFRLYPFRVMPQVCPPGLFILLTISCSRLGWVEGVASAWRVSGMLRPDITQEGIEFSSFVLSGWESFLSTS